jgi:putative membrane protein
VGTACAGRLPHDELPEETMTIRWILSAFHLLALGIGLGSVWARARALRAPLDSPGAFKRVFYADSLWGVAAIIWITTGVARAFGGFEKGSSYYMRNGFFLAKMAMLITILCLEVWPMVTLIRWRLAVRRGERVRTDRASSMAWISMVEAVLVILMVFAATAMARGLGAGAVG